MHFNMQFLITILSILLLGGVSAAPVVVLPSSVSLPPAPTNKGASIPQLIPSGKNGPRKDTPVVDVAKSFHLFLDNYKRVKDFKPLVKDKSKRRGRDFLKRIGYNMFRKMSPEEREAALKKARDEDNRKLGHDLSVDTKFMHDFATKLQENIVKKKGKPNPRLEKFIKSPVFAEKNMQPAMEVFNKRAVPVERPVPTPLTDEQRQAMANKLARSTHMAESTPRHVSPENIKHHKALDAQDPSSTWKDTRAATSALPRSTVVILPRALDNDKVREDDFASEIGHGNPKDKLHPTAYDSPHKPKDTVPETLMENAMTAGPMLQKRDDDPCHDVGNERVPDFGHPITESCQKRQMANDHVELEDKEPILPKPQKKYVPAPAPAPPNHGAINNHPSNINGPQLNHTVSQEIGEKQQKESATTVDVDDGTDVGPWEGTPVLYKRDDQDVPGVETEKERQDKPIKGRCHSKIDGRHHIKSAPSMCRWDGRVEQTGAAGGALTELKSSVHRRRMTPEACLVSRHGPQRGRNPPPAGCLELVRKHQGDGAAQEKAEGRELQQPLEHPSKLHSRDDRVDHSPSDPVKPSQTPIAHDMPILPETPKTRGCSPLNGTVPLARPWCKFTTHSSPPAEQERRERRNGQRLPVLKRWVRHALTWSNAERPTIHKAAAAAAAAAPSPALYASTPPAARKPDSTT